MIWLGRLSTILTWQFRLGVMAWEDFWQGMRFQVTSHLHWPSIGHLPSGDFKQNIADSTMCHDNYTMAMANMAMFSS